MDPDRVHARCWFRARRAGDRDHILRLINTVKNGYFGERAFEQGAVDADGKDEGACGLVGTGDSSPPLFSPKDNV